MLFSQAHFTTKPNTLSAISPAKLTPEPLRTLLFMPYHNLHPFTIQEMQLTCTVSSGPSHIIYPSLHRLLNSHHHHVLLHISLSNYYLSTLITRYKLLALFCLLQVIKDISLSYLYLYILSIACSLLLFIIYIYNFILFHRLDFHTKH